MKVITYVEIDVSSWDGSSATQTFRFAMPATYLPITIDAIPSISSVSFNPAAISLGENLGQRASLEIAFNDHLHIFSHGEDDYDSGTFWGKWRGRYGTTLRGSPLRLIRGTEGQELSSMTTRHYVVESTSGPTPSGVYTIEAKDILKFADDDRSQAPIISNGSLAGSIDAVTDTIVLSPTGIGDYEYPSTGWICIAGKEVCEILSRSGDTLTVTRGVLGTTADDHTADDRVQIVLRYSGNDAADILYDLFVNYAGISSDYIDLTSWQAETATYLSVIYARTITEPTSVKTLTEELVKQAALAIWWDDLARQLRIQVLREISTDADTFDESRIIQGSLQVQEQPSKRISQVWAWFGVRDPSDQGAKEDNFRTVLANVDLVKEAEYGSAEIEKTQCKWIETLTAAERFAQTRMSRFRDPPRAFSFDLATSEIVSLAGGYQLYWWANQDRYGVEQPAKIQITKISAYPDRIHIEAEEMLASGVLVLTNTVLLFSTDGGISTWTVDATWNDADNFVGVQGPGGGGASGSADAGQGGGGGGYSQMSNIPLTPGSTVPYSIGLGGTSNVDGGQTFFGAATYGASTVAADGGKAGAIMSGAGQGGQASAGIGALRTSGGDGGNGAPGGFVGGPGGGGGGGAGGPNGDGADGGSNILSLNTAGAGGGGADGGYPGHQSADQSATPGDGGNNRYNFGGGTQTLETGQEGGGGRGSGGGFYGGEGGTGEQLFTQTVAPIVSAGPGGGGGGGLAFSVGLGGGDFGGGGGGGGRSGDGGTGADGFIVISWREAA